MILINSHGWTVEYNGENELYSITDPMGNKCITAKLRIINPDHFIISHEYIEENICPSMSIPCLGKHFNAADQKKMYKILSKRQLAYVTKRSRRASKIPTY